MDLAREVKSMRSDMCLLRAKLTRLMTGEDAAGARTVILARLHEIRSKYLGQQHVVQKELADVKLWLADRGDGIEHEREKVDADVAQELLELLFNQVQQTNENCQSLFKFMIQEGNRIDIPDVIERYAAGKRAHTEETCGVLQTEPNLQVLVFCLLQVHLEAMLAEQA